MTRSSMMADQSSQRFEYASERAGRRPPRVAAGTRRESLGTFSDHVVYAVDGESLRRDVFCDFTMGGNSAVYAFVPEGEFWVDACLHKFDRAATLLHEAVEFYRMKDGLSYSDAHDIATERERKFRDTVSPSLTWKQLLAVVRTHLRRARRA